LARQGEETNLAEKQRPRNGGVTPGACLLGWESGTTVRQTGGLAPEAPARGSIQRLYDLWLLIILSVLRDKIGEVLRHVSLGIDCR